MTNIKYMIYFFEKEVKFVKKIIKVYKFNKSIVTILH